jgi:hypothetical protein
MRQSFLVYIAGALLAVSAGASAHHSFAIYDMETDVEFEGVVETLKFRNPHMAMTMLETQESGEQRVINFVEGAPANMLVRMGFDPVVIQPGKSIKAIGSPRKDDPDAFFLKSIILEDGTRFDTLGGGGRERR